MCAFWAWPPPWPAVVTTCALVSTVPDGETTKPDPCPAAEPPALAPPKYETIVTTPADRRAKICAGWKPFPTIGFATITGVPASPEGTCSRTTTVWSPCR